MKNADSLRTLKAELKYDIEQMSALLEKYERVKQKLAGIEPDEFDYIALAYMITNLYDHLENYFLRISKAFENQLDPPQWHKQLLLRMPLEIEGLRPAFMSTSDLGPFDELRAFRHVFRHGYQHDLDLERLLTLDQSVPAVVSRFRELHAEFLKKLDGIIERLEP